MDTHIERHIEGGGQRKMEQRLEWCLYKPRNTKDANRQQKLGEESEGPPPGSTASQHLDLRLLASSLVRECIFVVLSTQFIVPCYDRHTK